MFLALEMDIEGHLAKKRLFSTAFFGFGCEDDDVCKTSKRQCVDYPKSVIEDLPQEILTKMLCGVEHGDLKSLLLVSRTIREAALIAKESHFNYTTPRRSRDNINQVVPPNAPKRSPRARLSAKKLADISVALFVSVDDAIIRPVRTPMLSPY